MRRLQRWSCSLIAILPLSLASCAVESRHPLTEPERSEVDDNLNGLWFFKSTDGIGVYSIGSASETRKRSDLPRGTMRIAMNGIDWKNGVDRPQDAVFFATRLTSGTYFNLFDEKTLADGAIAWDKSEQKYCICKYRVNGDKLEIRFPNLDNAARDIEGGKVRGEVTRNKYKKAMAVLLTDSTENLRKYLQTGGDQSLFSDGDPTFALERMRIPEK